MTPDPPTRFTPTVGTLAYVWDRGRDEVLVVHRNARTGDDHYGKVNGLGGKVERDEDVVGSLRRELHEEATIEVTSLVLRGTITWSGFGPAEEDWLGFVFLVDGWTGTPPSTNAEGRLEWVPRRQLLGEAGDELPMWPGDREFLPLVFDDDPRAFHGTMPYVDGEPTSWHYERV